MITWQTSPEMAALRRFALRLSDQHPEAARDMERSLNESPKDLPCWLDLRTPAYPRNTARGWEPSGPECRTGNSATAAIYQTWQAMETEGRAPEPRLLSGTLLEAMRKRAGAGAETPEGILHPESWTSITALLQDAALRYLGVHAAWVADALEYRNEQDFHYALWRARRMPEVLRETTLQGGPSSPELRAWRGTGYDDSSEIRTWLRSLDYMELDERRTSIVAAEFRRHMGGLHPEAGWTGDRHFTMEQLQDGRFQEEFRAFVREELQKGRIGAEDAARLARKVVGDALCPGDSFTWGVVTALDGRDGEGEARRTKLVTGLLGPRPENP